MATPHLDEVVVLETEDPVEVKQPTKQNTDPLPSEIDGSAQDVVSALEKFKHASIIAKDADFSDTLGSKKYRGYTSLSLAEKGALDESLQERYNRLSIEVQDFLGQLSSLQGPDNRDDGSLSASQMAENVRSLSDRLKQAELDGTLDRASSRDTTPGADRDAAKRLMAAIESAKATTEPSKTTADNGSSGVTYELIYTPEQAKYQQLSRMAGIEQRVAKLEALLGDKDISSVATFLDVPDASLTSAVGALASRVDGMAEVNLGDLERRLSNVSSRLAELKNFKDSNTLSAEHLKKIEELHAIAERWDTVAASLPMVVDRLQELRTLHEQASEFSSTVVQIRSVQDDMREKIATHDVTMKTLEESLNTNATTIETNFKALEERMNKVIGKL